MESQKQVNSEGGKKKRGKKSEKITPGGNSHHVDIGVRLDNLITASQVLGSEEDEVAFPLSLSLPSSESSNETEEQEMQEVEEDDGSGWGGSEVATPTAKVAQTHGDNRSAGHRGGGVRRAASFSRLHSYQLSENFQQINSRATSLSAHQSMIESDSSTLKKCDFHVSPAAKIKPMTPTFHLPSATSTSTSPLHQPPSSNVREDDDNCRKSDVSDTIDLPELGVHSSHLKEEETQEVEEEEEEVVACLAPLRQAMTMTREILGMAKARQGPIMLLSTDLVRCASWQYGE